MPKLKVSRVVSFSSEDPAYPAKNILLGDPKSKWKCKTPGEKSAIIVLELEKASVITGIDIGNENSAYVEVLVTRSGTDEEYKPLLVMSSFMTPMEARKYQNINKVRMFSTEELSKPECEQQWDRIKIVCTQPFNRQHQYGLSFINFYGSEEKPESNVNKLGKFTLRSNSPDDLEVGNLFARRKEIQQPSKGEMTIKEAVTAASTDQQGLLKCKAQLNSGSTPKKDQANESVNEPPSSRYRNELLYSQDEERHHEKIDKIIERKMEERQKAEAENEKNKKDEKTESQEKKNDKNRKHTENTNKKNIDTPSTSIERKKRKNDSNTPSKKKAKLLKKLPFNQLLKGVVLVISGIQNPRRSNVRSKALEMGAKYKPDWDNSSTHLICAFMNTPKYKQVKGKGKIVTANWIEDCYSQRKRLPWRRYALDPNEGGDESEEEILEEVEEDRETNEVTEDMEPQEFDNNLAEVKNEKETESKENKYDPYLQDTDEEVENLPQTGELPKLKDFFQNKKFYIDQNLDEDVSQKLIKYITAYDGQISDDPIATFDYVVTNENGVSVLKEIITGASFLLPDWVWKCHNEQKLVETSDYLL